MAAELAWDGNCRLHPLRDDIMNCEVFLKSHCVEERDLFYSPPDRVKQG